MNLNERLDNILNAVKGMKPDEALTQQVSDLSAKLTELTTENATLKQQVGTLQSENKDLKAQVESKDGEIAKLKGEKETAEAKVLTLEGDLKAAKSTIEDPKGHIQKSISDGVKSALANSGHPPVSEPEGNAGSGPEAGGKQLTGRERVAAAWNERFKN